MRIGLILIVVVLATGCPRPKIDSTETMPVSATPTALPTPECVDDKIRNIEESIEGLNYALSEQRAIYICIETMIEERRKCQFD